MGAMGPSEREDEHLNLQMETLHELEEPLGVRGDGKEAWMPGSGRGRRARWNC